MFVLTPATGVIAGRTPDTTRCRPVRHAVRAHQYAIAHARTAVERVIATEGKVTLASFRDELQSARECAQTLLEHLGATRITRHRDNDSRFLRRPATRGWLRGPVARPIADVVPDPTSQPFAWGSTPSTREVGYDRLSEDKAPLSNG